MENLQPIDILLVEDNEDDIIIINRTFKKLKLTNNIYTVRDGQEALDFVFKEGKYALSPTPGLILLDINMPKLSGFDVLERLKAHPVYKIIPVIMLTVSDREEDIVRSYKNGAVSYITKSMKFDDFVTVMEHFELYWTLVSKVPRVR
ncbi:MAG: response regulator [bacterium]